jgi:hypothetical protein
MSILLTKAIQLLCPNAEFSFENNDYSTIQWDVLEGKAPTASEIKAAIEQVKANESSAKAQALADKESAQAKLSALGLSLDELKAIGL